MVVAPFNGYISEAPFRPGDIVKEGDVLCLLDDRDLKLERLTKATEKVQLQAEYQSAMAKLDGAQMRIIKAKIDQTETQISLLSGNQEKTLLISGTGDVIEPDEGIIAIGSGGNYAYAAALAYMEGSEMSAREIAERSLQIASKICIFTNSEIVVEELSE